MKYDVNAAQCSNNSNNSPNENAYSNYNFYTSNSYEGQLR